MPEIWSRQRKVDISAGIPEVRGSRLPGEVGGCLVKSRASEPRSLWMADPGFVLLSCMLLARLRVSHHYSEDNANNRSASSMIRITRWEAGVLKNVGHRSNLVGHGNHPQKKIEIQWNRKYQSASRSGRNVLFTELLLCVCTGL